MGPKNIVADNKVNNADKVKDGDNLDPGSVNHDLPKTPEAFPRSNTGESIEVACSNEDTSDDVDEKNNYMNVAGEVPSNGFEQCIKICSHIYEISDKTTRSGMTPAEAITEEDMDDIEQSHNIELSVHTEPIANACEETGLKRIRREDDEGEMRSGKHRRVLHSVISKITLTL